MNDDDWLRPSDETGLASIDSDISEKPVDLKLRAENRGEWDTLTRDMELSTRLHNFEPVWEQSQGENVKVAVLDTGLDTKHPAFPAAMIARAVSINHGEMQIGKEHVQDENGHGTHCAGIVAARALLYEGGSWIACVPAKDSYAKTQAGWIKGWDEQRSNESAKLVPYQDLTVKYSGVAPRCDLMIYRITQKDASGKDRGVAKVSDMALAIDDAVDNKADIISISIQAERNSDQLFHAVHRALSLRKIIVCSAGNRGSLRPVNIGFPARYGGVITVAAHNRFGQPAAFTSTGGEVDMSAPGEDVWSTWTKSCYARQSGTSMAAPWVAGIAALIFSKHRSHPKEGPTQRSPVRNIEEMREHLLRMAAHTGHFRPEDGYGALFPGDYFGRYSAPLGEVRP